MSIRQFLEKRPALGWGIASILLVIAAVAVGRSVVQNRRPALAEEITIRCVETGKEWKLPRGVVEKQLIMRPYPLSPDEGLPNPDTGKLTGFPVDDWKRMVEGINSDRKAAMEEEGIVVPTPPTPPRAPTPPPAG